MIEEKTGHGYYVTIPMRILLDETLNPKARLLFGVIANLSNQRGYCFATNAYLAEITGWHKNTVSDFVNQLIESEYVYRMDEVTKTGTERRLFLGGGSSAKPRRGSQPNDEPPLSQSAEQNNIIYTISEKDSSLKNDDAKKPAFKSGKDTQLKIKAEENTIAPATKPQARAQSIDQAGAFPEYKPFIDIWHERYPGILTMPKDGAKVKSLIRQAREVCKFKGIDPTPENVVELWKIFVGNLHRTWGHLKDLSTIDSKFKSLVAELEQGGAQRRPGRPDSWESELGEYAKY